MTGCLAFLYVSWQFLGGVEPEKSRKSTSYQLTSLQEDSPAFFTHENLQILVIKRSDALQSELNQNKLDYWDVTSAESRQPADANNRLRSIVPGYFVAIALGTDYVCPLVVSDSKILEESCNSAAQYDFAGRALKVGGTSRFKNLHVPEYEFNNELSRLTVYF